MGEQMIGQKQGSESKTYLTGASEDKGIDEPEPCTDSQSNRKIRKTASRIRQINCCLFCVFVKKTVVQMNQVS